MNDSLGSSFKSASSPLSGTSDGLSASRSASGSSSGSASALPDSVLASLDEARTRMALWAAEQEARESQMRARLESVQAQLDHLHAELGIAHEDIARGQRERDEALRLREVFGQERDQALAAYSEEHARLRTVQQELSMLATAHAQLQDAHKAALEAHRAEERAHEQARAAHAQAQQAHIQAQQAHAQAQQAHAQERQAHEQTRAAHAQERQAHEKTQAAHAQIQQAHAQEREAHEQTRQAQQQEKAEREAQETRRREEERRLAQEQQAREAEREQAHQIQKSLLERNKRLREKLLDVYSQSHATDLPSLILQVCVNLTGSECGLFVESDGDDTLAHQGFEELPEFIRQELYTWTRRVAQEQEPVHENDASKLPDHAQLVNIAALPVSLHSELKGVILVANKRSENGAPEDYTEEDTELLVAIGRHAGLAMENRRLHRDLVDSFEGTVAVLADAIEAKDAYTRGHCEGVSQLAVGVAEKLGFEGEALQQIRYAALLHDIGKIGVPDGILLKPGRLLPEEFLIIQKHSLIGRDLIARVPSLSLIAHIVMHHHERIDGTGYPNGLSGDGISLASRIICVADAFDAMTTPRPYRDPLAPHEAIDELRRCAGTHFDQRVVEVTAQVLAERMSG